MRRDRRELCYHRVGMSQSTLQFCENAAAAPRSPGAYILRIELTRPVGVVIAGRPPATLAAGHYLYCGSAYGPGGLRARLARHMRRDKSMHWHIDQLTGRGAVIGAWIMIGGSECDLVARLEALAAPIPGFGSSDCPNCRSHLLRAPDSSELRGALSSANTGRAPLAVQQGVTTTNRPR